MVHHRLQIHNQGVVQLQARYLLTGLYPVLSQVGTQIINLVLMLIVLRVNDMRVINAKFCFTYQDICPPYNQFCFLSKEIGVEADMIHR